MRSFLVASLFAIAAPLVAPLAAQRTALHQQIVALANDAHGKVAVACDVDKVSIDCELDQGGVHPMQSTFKLPLAICVLQLVQIGDLKLDQPIRFLPSDRYPGTYSPLQDAHPDANIDVPLHDLLQLSVGQSDNTATDILLRLLGGPQAAQESMNKLGLPAIHIRDSERGLHDNFQAQYRNDAEPAAMVALLRMLADHSPLSAEHTAL